MPTGYSAPIQNNPNYTFPDFVWDCARAFGALIMMRDEPQGAPIPEFIPEDNYHTKRLQEATQQLKTAMGRSLEEWGVIWNEHNAAASEQHRKLVEQTAVTRNRYEAMLAQVKAWAPPSNEHVELKNFMVQQIESSIQFDCWFPEPARTLPLREFITSEIDRMRDLVERYTQEAEKERERNEARNRWIRVLRESVPMPERLVGRTRDERKPQ